VRTGHESKVFRFYVSPLLRTWRYEQLRENDPRTATGRGFTGMSCYFRDEEFLTVLKEFLVQMLGPMIGGLKPGELFVEKTPSHALCLPEIRELLPESRIIHVLRDGRDVTASLVAAGRSWGVSWAPRRASAAAAMWVDHLTRAREAGADLDDRYFLEVRYEDLWRAPEVALRQIARFAGLEWHDTDIQKAVAANTAEAASVDGGTPIPLRGRAAADGSHVLKEPTDFVRRASPGGWTHDLTLWEQVRVWRIAPHVMREAGYPWDSPWSTVLPARRGTAIPHAASHRPSPEQPLFPGVPRE
jgi:hypothetical protein